MEGIKMELKHKINEEKKTREYTVTVTDNELNQFKERMTGPLDQDLLAVSRTLTDIVGNMIVRRILTDLTELDK
jgi:hypothetical protein